MNAEIDIPASNLKHVLAGMGKVIGRSGLPVLSCIKIACGLNRPVQIEGTNLEDYASAELDNCRIASDGEMLIPFEELNRIVRICSGTQSIHLIENEKQVKVQYPIGSSFAEQSLAVFDLKEWPAAPVIKGVETVVSEELKTAIRQALECASDDASRQVIQSACLDVADPNAHYVVGTNGSILYSANSFTFDLKKSLMIPDRKFLHWAPFWQDGTSRIAFERAAKNKAGWVQLKSDRWTFITKSIEGDYPNWKHVVPDGKPRTTLSLNDEAVKIVLNALPKLPCADAVYRPVTLTIEQGNLLLGAKQSDKENWTTLPVLGVTIVGEPISISLNRDYLVKALEFGLTEIEMTDNMAPLVFRSGGKKLIVMPLRPNSTRAQSQASPVAPVQNQRSEYQPETSKERSSMPTTVNRVEQHIPSEEPQETKSSFEQLQGQIERIKDTLKGVVSQLNEVLRTVTLAHKEKRATEKEIESVRDSLKEIQRIQI